jgi:hypothetical protein
MSITGCVSYAATGFEKKRGKNIGDLGFLLLWLPCFSGAVVL